MLAGILEPDEGEVWIDGEKIFGEHGGQEPLLLYLG